jgi:DNA-binding transcriptional MerR regulator
MKKEANDRVYKSATVASILDISIKTLHRKIKDGTFPAPARDSNNWRYWTQQDVEELQNMINPMFSKDSND